MKRQPKISLNIGKAIEIVFNKMTPFEKKVLRQTCQIRCGQVRTYKWIAKRIGCPNAQRAVGQALKKNPLPFLIPCHRVVASNGKIGGYTLGKKLKKQLLDFEKQLFTTP